MRPAGRTIAIALIAALAVIAGVRRYLPDLLSPWAFEDDARQHVWWTYRFADPALFQGDLAAEYFSAPAFAPPGYRALARAFVPFVDAQAFSEIVPFALTGIVAVLAWLLGRAVSGGSVLGGLAAAIFALQGGVLARVEGGLPRAWAMPVLLFGLWAVILKRWALFGVALVATAVFYPPLIVNLGLVGGLALAIDAARARKLPRNWIALGALSACALVIVVLAYRAPKPDPMGPKVTEAIARAMPEFGPDGRSHFFSADPVDYYLRNLRSGLGIEPDRLLAFAAVLALGAWLLPRAVPLVVWLVPATALAGYLAAHATLFHLHLPSRYTRFALPAFAMLWLAAIVPAAWERVRRLAALERARAFLGRRAVLLPLLALAAFGLAVEAALHVRADLSREPRPGYAALMGFVSGLPPDTLIAAHPTDASDIPLLARRSVVACEETSTPYDLGYYARMKERISAELAACYAADWSEVDRLADRFGVSVFVADRARYARPIALERVYFEPFRTEIRPLLERGAAAGFVLESPPEDRVLFRSGDFLAVRVRRRG